MTPDDLGWGPPCPQSRITTFSAGGITLTAHVRAVPLFRAFIEDIVERGYPVAGPVKDDWGYNCRRIAGSETWSWHAWGLAIDLNALKNPMGPSLITDMPPWIDEVAARYGLVWGGNFNRRKDAMHFELHRTPAQVANMVEDLAEGDVSERDVLNALRSDEGQRYLERAVDHLMSQGLTGDRDGAIRKWAIRLEGVQTDVKKIIAHLGIGQ